MWRAGFNFFLRFLRSAAVVHLACLLLALSACNHTPDLRNLKSVLRDSWRSYQKRYISPEGRIVLTERDGETISEAQAYALMRAVWAGDETAFARVYAWTQSNLSRWAAHGDNLLAWRWGKGGDGSWQVLDWNTAADADLDYAMALWLANRRGWKPRPPWPDYGSEARRVMEDILTKEVVSLPAGELLLAPGNWHEPEAPYLINPSYFSPGAYRLFMQVNPDPRWNGLHAVVYPFLERLGGNLANVPGVGLYPDWVQVKAQGQVAPAPDRDTHFGWEAVRLPWRLALDRLWFREKKAARLMGQKFLPFFKNEWQKRGKLLAVYSYEGRPLVAYESPVIYAGVLGAAMAAGDWDFARQMAEKILSFYQVRGEEAYFVSPDNYYANNWAWLGLALYAGWVELF